MVRPAEWEGVLIESFNRMRGELRMHGLVPMAVDLDEVSAGSLSNLDATAKSLGARAVILLQRSSTGIRAEVRMFAKDQVQAELSAVEISLAEATPAILAIRTIDHLRARLAEPDLISPPRPTNGRGSSILPTSSAIAQSVAPAPAPYSAGVETRYLHDWNALGGSFAPAVFLQRSLTPRFTGVISLAGPFRGHAVAFSGAKAQVSESLLLVSVAYQAFAWKRLRGSLVTGPGAMYFSLKGEAQKPWVPNSTHSLLGLLHIGSQLEARLTLRLALTVAVQAVFLVPVPVMEVADRDFRVGQPMILGTLGLRVSF